MWISTIISSLIFRIPREGDTILLDLAFSITPDLCNEIEYYRICLQRTHTQMEFARYKKKGVPLILIEHFRIQSLSFAGSDFV